MRTNRLALFAASLVAMYVSWSCSAGEDLTSVRIPPPAVFFTSWTDTIGGTCENVNDLNVGVPALDPGNVFAINRGDTVQMYVIQRFSPGACHPTRHFRWESMDTTVVTVRTIDSTTGRVMGISSGTRQFCIVDSALPSFRRCAFVTVRGGTTGGTPSVSISPRSLTIQTGGQCTLTRQFTATTSNPSGQSVTWSVNSSGSVISSTGLLTVPNGVSGSGYVKAVASSGAMDSTNFTLDNTSCGGTGNPTPVSINAEPTNTALVVNQTLALSVGGPYRVTVTYADASTKVNDMSVVSATSSDPLKVSVNSSTGLVTALQVTVAGGGVILTYCVTGTTICDTVFVSVSGTPVVVSTIDYTPAGGTITTSSQLTVLSVRGTADTNTLNPFWSVSDPVSLNVRGNGTPVVVAGTTFYPGMTATLTVLRASSSSFIVCVQWSITRTAPSACHTWGPIAPTSGVDLYSSLGLFHPRK